MQDVGEGGPLRWNDLELILAIGRAGSLSGAARTLGLNHSTVFRKINAVESRTKLRFFERLPSGYQLTEVGETAIVHAERVESEMHALGLEILGQDRRLEGPVRITAPEGMAAVLLPQMLSEFTAKHPGLSVEVVGTRAPLDLSKREAEVAVRATRAPPESALGRRVCCFRFGFFATPEFIQENEGRPLAEMDWVSLAGLEDWLVPSVWKRRAGALKQMRLRTSSIVGVINAAATGRAVTVLPLYLGEPDPRLKRLGDPIGHLNLDLWVLTHPDLKRTTRVRVVMDELYEFFKARRPIFEG